MTVRAYVLASVLMSSGCAKAARALAPTPSPPAHRAIVCDASDSGRGASCTLPALSRAVRTWAREAVDHPRSKLVVVRAGRTRSDAEVIAHAEVPPSWGPGYRARRLAWQREAVAGLPVALDGVAGSAVLEAAHVAWGMLPPDGSRSLVVLSDLREVTGDRAHNLERRVPRADRFLAWIARSGLRLDLRGAGVAVCGMHHHDAPGSAGFGARHDAALRALWEAVFRDAGAQSVDLAARCEEDAAPPGALASR